MPKKIEETEEIKDETVQEEAVEEKADKKADTTDDAETEKLKAKKKTAKAKNSDDETVEDDGEKDEDSSIIQAIADTVAGAVETVSETASAVVNTVAKAVGIGDDDEKKSDRGNRSERIGVVASDKMTKTVTVRVDRLVKHPMYRKYVRKKKKFMAHDELGAAIGDKVRIVETRPLSARKRWRVVEIIQKAER